jgi:hypothetical protein
MTKNELSAKIQEANNFYRKEHLTIKQFASFLNMNYLATNRLVLKHWEKWSVACAELGIECGPSDGRLLVPKKAISQEECLKEIRRVANILNTNYISQRDFNKHSKILSATIRSKFNSWEKALMISGLKPGKNFYKTIELKELANEFYEVAKRLSYIPSLNQMVHRGKFSERTYTRKFKKYSTFKAIVSKYIVDEQLCKDKNIIHLFEIEAKNIKSDTPIQEIRPHYEGKTLNFRHFAYTPTYENEVVSIFSAVAGELGFEIITIRDAFPDCKARRKSQNFRNRMQDCLIEFEFKSSDFVKHKHPIDGCNLVICWEHDWLECPIEVLNLKTEINKLNGWK